MKAIFKLNNGDYINIPADQIDVREQCVCAWNGENIVAIVKLDLLDSCFLSEKECVKSGKG